MKGVPLPPDHRHLVRVIFPGYVGGCYSKWLHKIWASIKENYSYHRIWDSRFLPAFITEKDGDLTMLSSRTQVPHALSRTFRVSLRSAIRARRFRLIVRGNGRRIEWKDMHMMIVDVQFSRLRSPYRDATWLCCVQKFPEAPTRHGISSESSYIGMLMLRFSTFCAANRSSWGASMRLRTLRTESPIGIPWA